jgi:4-amino-4-deoxy-L-arabinose transferase-like glycosyltransferase
MRDNSRRWLGLILIASVLVRVGVAFYLGDVVDALPLLTDQRSYHFLAVRLLEGHGYSFEEPWYPSTPAETPTAHWSFLYPLFIAAVYVVFGVHPLAARVVQAMLGGLLLPWMVYRLTRTVFGPSLPLTSPLSRPTGEGVGG